MKNLKERIKKYAVKLKSENNDLGSGVLWKSASCPENSLYVFTAAHVIKDLKVKIKKIRRKIKGA